MMIIETTSSFEILDMIDHINWQMAQMTIHQINNTKHGQRLQDRLDELRDMLNYVDK